MLYIKKGCTKTDADLFFKRHMSCFFPNNNIEFSWWKLQRQNASNHQLCTPTWILSNPAGPFLPHRSLLATKPQQLELSCWLHWRWPGQPVTQCGSPVRPTAPVHIARAVCIPGATAAARGRLAGCGLLLLCNPQPSNYGADFPRRGRIKGFNFSVTSKTNKRAIL